MVTNEGHFYITNTNVMHIDTSLAKAFKSDCSSFPGKPSKAQFEVLKFSEEIVRQSLADNQVPGDGKSGKSEFKVF